jgi:hypothetical protein
MEFKVWDVKFSVSLTGGRSKHVTFIFMEVILFTYQFIYFYIFVFVTLVSEDT